MDRREALTRVATLLGCAISAPTVEAVLADWTRTLTAGAPWTPATLTPEQDARVLAIADVILPATDTPGAKDVGVDAFIDAMLTRYYAPEERASFLEGLEQVDARARQAYGRPFTACADAQRLELVTALDREAFADDATRTAADGADAAKASPAAAWFRRMKELTLVGYYTSEVGATQELRVNPWGRYRGDMPYAEVGRSWS